MSPKGLRRFAEVRPETRRKPSGGVSAEVAEVRLESRSTLRRGFAEVLRRCLPHTPSVLPHRRWRGAEHDEQPISREPKCRGQSA